MVSSTDEDVEIALLWPSSPHQKLSYLARLVASIVEQDTMAFGDDCLLI